MPGNPSSRWRRPRRCDRNKPCFIRCGSTRGFYIFGECTVIVSVSAPLNTAAAAEATVGYGGSGLNPGPTAPGWTNGSTPHPQDRPRRPAAVRTMHDTSRPGVAATLQPCRCRLTILLFHGHRILAKILASCLCSCFYFRLADGWAPAGSAHGSRRRRDAISNTQFRAEIQKRARN